MSSGNLFRSPSFRGVVGASAGNASRASMAIEAAKMEAFRKVKPTCVSLMGLATQQPTLSSPHARLIDTLHTLIQSIPPQSFVPSLINYTLFPITNILRNSDPFQLPDTFLESAFRLLALMVRIWKGVQGGIEVQAWEQLWRFTVVAVSQRMRGGLGDENRVGNVKGKVKELDQEVQLQAVSLLTALLEPLKNEDGDLVFPNESTLKLTSGKTSKLLPTLLQTVSTLVDMSTQASTYLNLHTSILKLLRIIISTYLSGQPEILASVLPGIVSSTMKTIQREGKNIKSHIALELAGLVQDVLLETLNDDLLRQLGVLRPVINNLSQLAEVFDEEEETIHVDIDGRPNSPTPSYTSASTTTTLTNDPFPALSSSYLAFTSSQLQATITPLLVSLSSHSHPIARSASVNLAYSILSKCSESLSSLSHSCLNALLLLSTDSFDAVRTESKMYLANLLANEDISYNLQPSIVDLLSNSINSLPRLIMSQQDDKINEASRIIRAIAEMTVESGDKAINVISEFLGPQGAVERWGWALLNCLEFGRPPGWSAPGNVVARAAAKGWEQRLVTSSLPLLLESNTPDSPNVRFPHLPFRYIELEQTARSLAVMLVSLGTAGGDSALYTVDYFVKFAKANRKSSLRVAQAVSAIWVSDHLLQGISKTSLKSSRKMARDVTKLVILMDDDEDDDDDEADWDANCNQTSDALLPAERTKGVDTLTTLLDRDPRINSETAAQTRKLHTQAQRTLLSALSLSMLSTTSQILGNNFRPLLLNVLYTVLSHLASPHDLVQHFSEIALVQIAYYTGYASPQNLVMDNVDYVINVVSQRLTYYRLSPHAPLVLIAMIRLVGEPIVPLVHDVVDEIFDALDDFHGYETLCSALLAVLVTLIETMASETDTIGMTGERKVKLQELRRIGNPPNPKDDFERFGKWYRERADRSKKEINEILERAPRRPWAQDDDVAEDTNPSALEGGDETSVPLTRSQEICRMILEKAMFYLSHQSAFLRARVLSLIAHATPVLASGNRESDLLPLIDSGWGRILNRLHDEQPFVVVEAAEVIASLAENVGDFMSKRILDHAWPRLRQLLNLQREFDRRSALARGHGSVIGTESPFSVSHRLHMAIIRAVTCVVRDVPISDDVLWGMMDVFRPFLDKRAHEELQAQGRVLYEELSKRDGDAVWVMLKASIGKLEGDHGIWRYLHDSSLDIVENAEKVLVLV